MRCPHHPGQRNWTVRYALVVSLAFGLASLNGCVVGPDFKPPSSPVPARWTASPATAAEVDLARWWTVFGDSTLTSLEERAVQSNLELARAAARVRQARAARRGAVAGLGPAADASGAYRRSRSPAVDAGESRAPGVKNGTIEGTVSDQYQAGFDAGWELDLFGGVRRGIEAAEADLQAAVEARRDVLVTLTAEVARTYMELRSFQQRIAIAKGNLAAQAHSAELTRKRFRAGFVSGLDVANAAALAATTASQIPNLEASARQAVYSLGLLLGREPAALWAELSPPADIPAAPPATPAGVPSELLRRRPDIRRAEAEIHAATARVGVATADLFPRFTLTGSVGLQASDFSSWFTWPQRLWSFGPSASWRVFDTGRTRANIAQQEAVQEQALLAYRQTVLAALQEVESALIASSKEQERRQSLVEAVAANRKAVELASRLYTDGQVEFLNVLDAERSLYASEDALAQSTGQVLTGQVALFKALGGGWNEDG